MRAELFEYIDAQRDQYLAGLFPLLRQPSISATGQGMQACAELLAQNMRDVGVSAQILPTGGHPVVFGDTLTPDVPFTY